MRSFLASLACVLSLCGPAMAQEPSYEARLGLYRTGRVPDAEWKWGARAGTAERMRGGVLASWYDCARLGQCSRSKRTASGERFDPNGMTAAHKTLPFGARLRVCLRGCVVVRVSDRGPFIKGRSLDLSRAAARAIGLGGVARVSMVRVR